jgi:hypothetical protein
MVGVRGCFAGCAALGVLALLAGCSGGYFFAEREPWRREAEIACLNSGAVTEGAGIVRISAINGPGICGADFPLRVTALGEGAPLGFADDPRPPAAIPGGAPSWPIVKPDHAPATQAAPYPYPDPYPRAGGAPRRQTSPGEASISAPVSAPLSLRPPGLVEPPAAAAPQTYDYRHPYGAAPEPAPPERYRAPRSASSPREDLSPVPYEHRRLVDEGTVTRNSAVTRAPLRELSPADVPGASVRDEMGEPWREPLREPLRRPEVPPLVPLGVTRGAEPAGVPAPVSVNPPATLACPIVSELDRWIAGAVQPAALRWFGAPVAEIKQISAYSCRGMNGNPGAPISEHAFGNALDIAAFTLADGRTITVKNGWHGLPEEQGFLRDVQGAACNQFTTVLAPGSNAYHYDHIHVDLMRHASGYRVCNPHAVSGDEVAAGAGYKFAAHRTRDPAVTGSLAAHRPPRPQKRGDELKRFGADEKDDRFPDRALPLAQPGADGED